MMDKAIFHRRLTLIVLFIATFLTGAVFRSRSFDGASVDYQVILKLAAALIAAGYAGFLYRVWIARLLKIDGIFVLLMMLWYFVTCIWSPSLFYSAASMVTFMSIVILLYMASEVTDSASIVRTIIWSCSLISFISILVFYLVPDFGRTKEWMGGEHVAGNRMQGITGAANAMGYIAAFTCLMIYCYWRYLTPHLPRIYLLLLAINIMPLLMSDSRSSLIAMIMAVGIAFLQNFTPARAAAMFGAICALIAFLALVDLNAFLAMFSRSGDVSEILTGTGRTEIWAQVLPLIGQKPLQGWGFASSGFIMPSMNHSAPHAHNMFLQILFMTGWIGLLLTLPAIFIELYYALKAHDQFKVTLICFLLIQGLTEAGAFRGSVSIATLTLALVFALPYMNTMKREDA